MSILINVPRLPRGVGCMFSRFHKIKVCDRETDGQTDTQTDGYRPIAYTALYKCVAYASRGKNGATCGISATINI